VTDSIAEPIVGDVVHYYPDEKRERLVAASRRLRGGPYAALVVDVHLGAVGSHRVLTLRVFAHEVRRDRLIRDVHGSDRGLPGRWTPRTP